MIGNVVKSLVSGDVEHIGRVVTICDGKSYLSGQPVLQWDEVSPNWRNELLLIVKLESPKYSCDMKTYLKAKSNSGNLSMWDEEYYSKLYYSEVILTDKIIVPESLVEVLEYNFTENSHENN